ncbi:recombinase family protein [Bacillus siamensis]|uniref:recombinase family protein n=1 Tax=Bacillus siamensis TaxID=659243 RepID=UPI002E1CCAD8|nr:recombinase family protein [Bacillus siamensis]MED0773814.1 recombinase family protein [Bacillus siamensis]MED0775889.1 recombinase family protein [Bacillus siamensis]MED0781706.1 recombinase family protein [Bacillus siamensis]MED0832681.1 recombinase family protein [Bacillus siamensis]
MKKQPRVGIYFRTNHLNNMATLHHLEVYAKERELEPIIFLDIDSGVEQRQSLNHLLNQVRNQKVDIIITYSLSRFSRKTSEVSSILCEFKKFNARLILYSGQMEVAHHD